jgi:hypothetical protein
MLRIIADPNTGGRPSTALDQSDVRIPIRHGAERQLSRSYVTIASAVSYRSSHLANSGKAEA